MRASNWLTAASLSLLLSVPLAAQTFEHRGVQLFKQGQFTEAISYLSVAVKQREWRSNASMWNYLGLSYSNTGDYVNARKALDRATRLDPSRSEYWSDLGHADLKLNKIKKALTEANKAISLNGRNPDAFDLRALVNLAVQKTNAASVDAKKAIELDPTSTQGYLTYVDVLLANALVTFQKQNGTYDELLAILDDAKTVLNSGLDKASGTPRFETLNEERNAIEAFYKYFYERNKEPSDISDDTETALNLVSKPKAKYTDLARQNQVQGTVVLWVLFPANGNVSNILILKKMGYGLDEKALEAARQINFEPRTHNGQPIPTVRLVEYNFSIY